jgi:TRAP-type C4-dicarboxylate transport system permease small subunit
MNGFLDRYSVLLHKIGRGERWIAIVLLAVIVVCIFGQVVSRYAFGLPLVWVEELSTYAFIWCVFIGASMALKQNRHIKILSFVSRLPQKRQLFFREVTDGVILFFCLLLAVNGFKAMAIFEWNQRTIALPVELPRFLFYSLPFILGSFSMALTTAHDLLAAMSGWAGPVKGREEMSS